MQNILSPEQKSEIRSSLQRYFYENFDMELNELQGGLLLDYIMTEIAPFAYNQGVENAKAYFAARLDDLSGVCFEEVLTYWNATARGARSVARKPDR